MNILFTTYQGGIAGSTHSISYLANGLAQLGHNVHVAGCQGTYLQQLLVPRVHFHHIPFSSHLDLKSCYKLATILRSEAIQVINPQSGKDRTLTILCKWLFRSRATILFTRRQRPLTEPWIKRMFHLSVAEKIIVTSEGLKEIFLEKGYPEHHLQVILNGIDPRLADLIDPEKVESLRQNLQLSGHKVVGCISRLKNQSQLIRALKFLPPDLILLFVGIERRDLENTLKIEMPMQRIIFTGRIPHNEALQYFPLMDMKVLASDMDGFGLALVEAMALGIPVAGTRLGGIKSVIRHEENGLLFEDQDEVGLADCILRVLSDVALRQKLIEQGRKAVNKEFSIRQTVRNYEQFFEQWVK